MVIRFHCWMAYRLIPGLGQRPGPLSSPVMLSSYPLPTVTSSYQLTTVTAKGSSLIFPFVGLKLRAGP